MASEIEQKIIPFSARVWRKVVFTETESITASTATPARAICSSSGMPRRSNVRLSSGSTSSIEPRVLRGLRRRIIYYVLKIYVGNRKVRPRRQLHRQPMTIRLKAALEHPLGLALLLRDETYDIFVESAAYGFGVDVRREAVLVFAAFDILDQFSILVCHKKHL